MINLCPFIPYNKSKRPENSDSCCSYDLKGACEDMRELGKRPVVIEMLPHVKIVQLRRTLIL